MVGQVVRRIVPLTNARIVSAAPGMHVEGYGPELNITLTAARSPNFRYQLNRGCREIGLGALAAIPAPEARALVARLKLQIANTVDPLAECEMARKAAEVPARADAIEREGKQHAFLGSTGPHMALAAFASNSSKQRRIATRFDKTALSFVSFRELA